MDGTQVALVVGMTQPGHDAIDRRGVAAMSRGERLAAWGVAVALLGLVYTGFRDVGQEIDSLRAEVRTDLRRLDDRLRGVDIEFGKVDQRLLTLERVILSEPPD